MGGAGGHMSHPYDLDEVTNGSDLIKVLMSIPAYLAMEGVTNATIKLDGSNNSVKVIDRRGKFEFALDRGAGGLGKGEMDFAGLTPDDYEARGLNPGLQNSTNILLSILNEALEVAHIEPELRKLGLIDPDGKADLSKFLNTEFYEKENSNSIDYSVGNFISFHGVYQFYEKYHRRGQPGKLNPDAKIIRKGIDRPTYIDKKDNKEKFYKGPSVRLDYDAEAMARLVQKVRPFAKKRGFEIYGPAKVSPRTEKMAKEAIADMKASLLKPITINLSADRSETKSLGEWARESVNPLTTKYPVPEDPFSSNTEKEVYLGCADCIKLAAGGATNPYNKKKVYEPIIINKIPLVDYYADSPGQVVALAALNSAILFHVTRLLGQDIKNHLTTEVFGDVTSHEGIVIRGLAAEDFKITGEFMVDDSGGFAQKRPEAALQEEESEDEWHSDEYETLGDRKFADRPEEAEETYVEFQEPETFAIVPGAFKPPHVGHADMVRRYATGDGVKKADKVYVVISAPMNAHRTLRDGTVIDADTSIALWRKLFPEVVSLPNVECMKAPADMRSPITVAFKFISDESPLPLEEGDTVMLGASNKLDKKERPDWMRWNSIDKEKHVKPGIELLSGEETAVPAYERSDGGGFSASTMRDLISDLVDDPNNKKAYSELIEFVPKDKIHALFVQLGKPIPTMAQNPVNELSSGGGGSVTGYSGERPLPSGSAKPKTKKSKGKNNENLAIMNEVMRLIMERGTF